MATVTSLLLPAHGNSSRGRTPYQLQKTIDLTAQAISCTGGDVVQCLTIPANTKIIAAGFQVVESATMNTGTNATAALGFTGGDVDEFAAALDIDGATDGAYAPQVAIDGLALSTSGDTIDFVLAGDGASFTAGKLRAFAVMMDISDQGDTAANEVDRDALA